MQKLLIKDNKSKGQIYHWIRLGIEKYSQNSEWYWNDEDSLCAHFFSSISGCCPTATGKIVVNSYKIRGRGPSAPESKLGADGLGIISIRENDVNLEGYFLFQAKKAKKVTQPLQNSRSQCSKMLSHSSASFLLVLLPSQVKMVGAMAVHSSINPRPSLACLPFVTFPKFVRSQLLRGIMLEPLRNFQTSITPDLQIEIKNIITIFKNTTDTVNSSKESIAKVLGEFDITYYDNDQPLTE